MSDMNGNPHAEDAARFVNEASSLHDWPITERGIIATNGQALATLALAYEQRTANLIAYWSDMTADEDEWADTPFQREMDSISRDFRTRMGLPAEVAK